MSPSQPPAETAGRSVAGVILDWSMVLGVALVGGLTFLAKPLPTEGVLQRPVGLFYRQAVVGCIERGEGRLVPLAAVFVVVAAVLVVQVLLPRLAPDAIAGTAALGMILILAPVINYGPQVDVLAMMPEDAQVLGAPALTRFDPCLPVTWALLAWFLVALARGFVQPPGAWSPAAKASGFVTAMVGIGGAWLNRMLILARGNALRLDYYQWPYGIAAVWILVQLGAAAMLTALACRGKAQSKVVAGIIAALLVSLAVTGGGR